MHKKSALMFFSSAGALALSFTSLLPVAVADTGSWVAYGSKNPITSSRSTWKCQSSVKVDSGVIAQVCTVRSPGGGGIQGAVIVLNNRSSLYGANAEVTVYGDGNTWYCPHSGVRAHSWSVCFGRTFSFPYSAYSFGYVNNVYMGYTGLV